MNWEQRYVKLKPGDTVRLLFLDDDDLEQGLNSDFIGKTFTIKSYLGENSHGIRAYKMEEMRTTGVINVILYDDQIEKVIL